MALIIEFNEGAGNAVFPLLEGNKNPDLSLRAYDYSSHAVKLVQVFIPIHMYRTIMTQNAIV